MTLKNYLRIVMYAIFSEHRIVINELIIMVSKAKICPDMPPAR